MSLENIIKQICSITGIFYPVTSTIKTLVDNNNELINMKHEYDESLKRKILDAPSLSDIDKAIMISNIRKSTINFVNKARILGIAIENIEGKSRDCVIDNDWILYFFDHAENISNCDIQQIWGKILSLYIQGQISGNKKIINVLSLLCQEDISVFCNICSMTYDDLSKKGGQYPFIYIREYPAYYNNYGIRRYNLAQLDNLGLIEYDTHGNFVLPLSIPTLKYGNNIVELEAAQRVNNGNVRLTEIGQSLYKITDVVRLDDFIKHCKKVWDKKLINYTIKDEI